MRIGTKSVLYGAHAFWWHWIFIWIAWCKIYYVTFQPAMLVCFFVHDLGYWGKENMDGPEGQEHPNFGALLMGRLFDVPYGDREWYNFTAGHSRYFAKLIGIETSDLMRADKYATCLVPLPLYLGSVLATGEAWEYVKLHQDYHKHPSSGYRWLDLMWWALSIRKEWREAYGPL